jgi:hypothetical protein
MRPGGQLLPRASTPLLGALGYATPLRIVHQGNTQTDMSSSVGALVTTFGDPLPQRIVIAVTRWAGAEHPPRRDGAYGFGVELFDVTSDAACFL